MKKCTSNFPYEDLGVCYGQPVYAGLRPAVYAVSLHDVLKFPRYAAEAVESSSLRKQKHYGRLEAVPFLLAADRYWRRIDIVPTRSGLSWETQGEPHSRTFLNKATFVHPGSEADAMAFARQAIHDDLIYAVQQTDGSWRILGSPEWGTETKCSGTTGEGMTGEVGMTIEVEATQYGPAPFYVGRLQLSGGLYIDCFNGQDENLNMLTDIEALYSGMENNSGVKPRREGNHLIFASRGQVQLHSSTDAVLVNLKGGKPYRICFRARLPREPFYGMLGLIVPRGGGANVGTCSLQWKKIPGTDDEYFIWGFHKPASDKFNVRPFYVESYGHAFTFDEMELWDFSLVQTNQSPFVY